MEKGVLDREAQWAYLAASMARYVEQRQLRVGLPQDHNETVVPVQSQVSQSITPAPGPVQSPAPQNNAATAMSLQIPASPPDSALPGSLKRPLSPAPVSCTHDQLAKRLRSSAKTGFGRFSTAPSDSSDLKQPKPECLHCGEIGHSWCACDEHCAHCSERHPRQRCPKLDFSKHEPNAFQQLDLEAHGSASPDRARSLQAVPSKDIMKPVLGQTPSTAANMTRDYTPSLAADQMEGVTSERRAMIAAVPDPVLRQPVEGIGPHKTKSDAMPLGPRGSISRATIPRGIPPSTDMAVAGGSQPKKPVNDPRAVPVAPVRTTTIPISPEQSKIPSATAVHAAIAAVAAFGAPRAAADHYDDYAQMQSTPQLQALTGVPMMTFGAFNQAMGLHRASSAGTDVYGAEHMGIWSDLSTQIHRIVHGAQDATRSRNNGTDRAKVEAQIQQALIALKSMVLRGKRDPKQPTAVYKR